MATMLTASEIDQFVEEGFVAVREAFPSSVAAECRSWASDQLGIDTADPDSWTRPVVRGLVEGEPLAEAANGPRLIEAVGQLLDPDPWHRRRNLGAFVVRFPTETDPGDTGWHIDSSYQPDGDQRWFVNYLSRARGLLMLCLLSDVGSDDAPTRVLPGSHFEMARLLEPAGEEGLPGAYFGQESGVPLPDTTGRPETACGSAGDVFLCHPFLVHAAGWPHPRSRPRFISQPPISLPGTLDIVRRPRSAVAEAIRRGLRPGWHEQLTAHGP